jgi:hypothetical protein
MMTALAIGAVMVKGGVGLDILIVGTPVILFT